MTHFLGVPSVIARVHRERHRRRSRWAMWRGANLTRFEGMRLPGYGDRSGREARLGSQGGGISGLLQDRGGG